MTTKRAWQRMLSGRRLNLLDPSPLDIEIEDIAHGLSRVSRWNGQTSGPWPFSVAHHSVLVLRFFQSLYPEASSTDQLKALLHDAPEYVMGDMISPFKAAIGSEYDDLEERLMQAIHLRFSLEAKTDPRLKKKIKKCDLISARIEAVQLAGFSESEAVKIWGKLPEDFLNMTIEDLTPDQARDQFITEFQQIFQEL